MTLMFTNESSNLATPHGDPDKPRVGAIVQNAREHSSAAIVLK